jgi:two-component system phosphate regulon response regulator PhoB
MRKRVLVAESADAVRQVVESVLRQNGYDVIAVSSFAKASEVLQFSRPDLIVAGGDLADAGRQVFHEVVQNSPETSSIPLLVIEPADKSSVGLPSEVVISRPIDPIDFVQRVGIFLGEATGRSTQRGQNPLSAAPTDDHFLDAALGLDRIDVTHSEDMDNTGTSKMPVSKPAPPGVTPYDRGEDEDSLGDSRRVESLHIRDDATDIRARNTPPPARKAQGAGTGKIEIMPDQYGISEPAAFQIKPEQKAHDYDWFVNAVRDDVAGTGSDKSSEPGQSAPPVSAKTGDSQKLHVNNTASIVDPITSVATPVRSYPDAGVAGPRSSTEGVEKFIDEFKREIELLRAREPEPGPVPVVPRDTPPAKNLSWEEQVEALSADHVRLFTKEFTAQLAARLAERIVSKIDPDKLLNLLKEEIMISARRRGSDKR